MLQTIEAWAQAAMGNGRQMRRTLGEAEELFVSDNGDVPPPSWMQNFDEADLHGMQALAYRTLAEHEPSAAAQAQLHAKRAISLRAGGHERSMIFDYLSLASACFIADDPEQADRYARMALLADRADLLAPHLGPAAARCTGSPPGTPATATSRSCARRSRPPCRDRRQRDTGMPAPGWCETRGRAAAGTSAHAVDGHRRRPARRR